MKSTKKMSNIYLHIKTYSKNEVYITEKQFKHITVLFYVSLVLYMLKKTFDQPCLVIANLLAHYVLKLGNNWLYKGYWQGKVFPKIYEKFFFPASWLNFFYYLVRRKQVYIFCGLISQKFLRKTLLRSDFLHN